VADALLDERRELIGLPAVAALHVHRGSGAVDVGVTVGSGFFIGD
jgi:hypothetical protein